jgi:hypothetical protein
VRYPAVYHVASEARQTLGRFPLVVITGWVCAIAFILDGMSEVLRASLGLPLFLALALFGERRGWSGWRRLALSLIGVAILAAFFVAWPTWSDGVANRRFIQLSVGFHLLVAVLPYVGDPDIDAFWEYNKRLFLRFLIAYLYSMVLFVGLAVAMLAMDNLLGIEFDDSNYMRLWAVVAFIFNTWFFLAGVPKSLESLGERSSYPMGLKVFAQFVLVPLVALYLVILSVYLVKVIVTQQWPTNWIGWLVSSVAVVGILSVLLVYPVRHRADSSWIRTYSRLFYIALLPSVAMLLMAIWQRVHQYGVTENRYFLIVLACWLALIAVYFAVRSSRNIKLIPTTLALLALVTFFGPWGAYTVSRNSQLGRLTDLLAANGLLANDGQVVVAENVAYDDRHEISAALRYLIQTHGEGSLGGLAQRGADTPVEIDGPAAPSQIPTNEEAADRVMKQWGLAYVPRWAASEDREFFSYYATTPYTGSGGKSITGFDYVTPLVWSRPMSQEVAIGADTLEFSFDEEANVFRVLQAGSEMVTIPLAPLVESLRSEDQPGRTGVPPEQLRIEGRGEQMGARLDIRSMNGRRTESGLVIQQVDGEVYLDFE